MGDKRRSTFRNSITDTRIGESQLLTMFQILLLVKLSALLRGLTLRGKPQCIKLSAGYDGKQEGMFRRVSTGAKRFSQSFIGLISKAYGDK